jgi:hypothetical protein
MEKRIIDIEKNHLPIIFPIAGVIVMVTVLISKSEATKRTAFMIFIIRE